MGERTRVAPGESSCRASVAADPRADRLPRTPRGLDVGTNSGGPGLRPRRTRLHSEAMLHALRQILPPRAGALVGLVAILCALGLEVQAAAMGHHPHDAPDTLAPATANAGGHHQDCDDVAGDHAPVETAFSGCCHPVACPGAGIALPAQRTGAAPAAAFPAASFRVAAGLSGLRPTPPLRPPRQAPLPL